MNKWLSMGVTPAHIIAALPQSEASQKTEKHRKGGVKGGMGGKPNAKRRDFMPELEKLYATFGHKEFTYRDLMEIFGFTRFAADKLLLMIRRRTTILAHRKAPRTSKGNTPALYALKPGWREQVVKDLDAFNGIHGSLTTKNTSYTTLTL